MVLLATGIVAAVTLAAVLWSSDDDDVDDHGAGTPSERGAGGPLGEGATASQAAEAYADALVSGDLATLCDLTDLWGVDRFLALGEEIGEPVADDCEEAAALVEEEWPDVVADAIHEHSEGASTFSVRERSSEADTATFEVEYLDGREVLTAEGLQLVKEDGRWVVLDFDSVVTDIADEIAGDDDRDQGPYGDATSAEP